MAKTAGSFSKDNPKPGPGRKKMTEDEKRQARILRAVDYDFKQHCRQLLPLAVDQLEAQLVKGKVKMTGELLRSLEVLRDSVHGKPAQTITGPDGGPLVGSFTILLGKINGAKTEKI